ncbi:MAG TPA: cell division protein FtsZ [Ktedonobacterales bacterium]|nr:cell division protein FtsZ [Ktedonobacterales bacterium]
MNPGQTGGTAGANDAEQLVRGDVIHIGAESSARHGGVPSVPVVTPAPKAAPSGIARLLAVGVGGAGSNAINHMIEAKVPGIEFLAMNTDAQALDVSRAPKRIRLGETLTRGLGAGGNPEIGRKAAEESYAAIREALAGSDMVFITAGMGGGTGTGAAPLVAQAAREQGALAIAVVTTPFAFERRRKYLAEQGIEALRDVVDALIVVPNERLMQIATDDMSAFEAYRKADDVLRQGIQGISDLIMIPGLINLDFADVKAIMAEAGSALMAIGEASGDRRAEEAARGAITNPLLDVDISGAHGVIFNITGGDDLTMREVNTIADVISGAAHPDANIIFGTVYDPASAGRLKITVVATGFEPRVSPGGQRGLRAKAPIGLAGAAPAPRGAHAIAPANAQRANTFDGAISVAGPGPRVAQTPTPRDAFTVTPSPRVDGADRPARIAPREVIPPQFDEPRAPVRAPLVDGRDGEQGKWTSRGSRAGLLTPGYHGDEFIANEETEEAESRSSRPRWGQIFGRR